jgi:hypothetical protein
VKSVSPLTSRSPIIEFGHGSLHVLDGEEGLDLPIARTDTGRMTEASRDQIILRLREFLARRGTRRGVGVCCAVAGRGVSLRQLNLPRSSEDDVERLLTLQIEAEFPLPPEELAWGYCQVAGREYPGPSGGEPRSVTVMAVKRDQVVEVAEVLRACGLSPVFTFGAWARSGLAPADAGDHALLELGRGQTELLGLRSGVPNVLRVLSWGLKELEDSVAQTLGGDSEQARNLIQGRDPSGQHSGERMERLRDAVRRGMEPLREFLHSNWNGSRLYVVGAGVEVDLLVACLRDEMGRGVEIEALRHAQGEGRSAATLGLREMLARNGAAPGLVLRLTDERPAERGAGSTSRKWVVLAALLALGCVALRYLEPAIRGSRLAGEAGGLRSRLSSMPPIDRELGFLQHLEANQAHYLDALGVLADAAPRGIRVESLTLSRRGEFALRAMLQAAQAAEFRSKLADSGLFVNVVVQEQTPTPDNQQVTLRITAQWKTNWVSPPRGDPDAPPPETATAASKHP